MKGSVLDVVAERLLGARAGDIMGIVSIISLAASINALTFAGPRVYFAMARDGVFFPAAARVHPQLQDAGAVDRRAGDLGDAADSDRQPRRARQLRRLRHHAVCGHRRRGGVRAARARAATRRVRSRRSGYPVTPAIFVLVSLAIVVNAIYTQSAS